MSSSSSPHLSLVGDDGHRPAASDPGLAVALADAAATLHRATSAGSGAVLGELVAASLRLVPGGQDASVIVVRRHEHASRHATSVEVEQVDAHQLAVREGPCLEAVGQARPVRVSDMAQETRWSSFTPRARLLGVRSSLSLPLRADSRVLGALNLFSREVGAFDDESEQAGLLLSGHAAIALAHAHAVEHLARAVTSRDLIGQAKGRLMERYDIGEERAFDALRRVSQSTHRKLHDVARELAASGELSALTEAETERP